MEFINPDNLPDIFASGPMSMVATDTLAIVTFTQARFTMQERPISEIVDIAPGKSVVVARVVLPIENARQLHALLQRNLFKDMPTAGNA